ncbi:hypothetical protein LTR56_017748 [Elasticomyces elasticus]|nr:hypothetical protein LTR56_017748 [Elasticomyces elasticus]KAK3637717.1 hypothetical protein LTR22_018118 [Elasticomyces elasticus]KAK4915386.1 hypothetical protein LTR49_016517 [Elasticomyces elasticus]KAK5752249.1 hypothetical protein LTS12_017643 [Elasticomyces elasticus]
MLAPGAILILLRAAVHPKHRRTPKQQATIDALQAKFTRSNRKCETTHECQYCYEHKEAKDFVKGTFLPWTCQFHLTGSNKVCTLCLQASISAQLDSKTLIDIGCPQCGAAWEPEDVRMLAGPKDSKRLKSMDAAAQKRVLVPPELPDSITMDDLLNRGVRACPGCLFPFLKVGGCDSVSCGKCGRCFNVIYALVLVDGFGRRAADVGEYSNIDLL